MPGFGDLFERLDSDPNVRGRQFEHICKWYLEHDPRYRDQFEKVWLWDEWPGRWGPDAGIDLVAKHTDGSLWAIQAKAYDPNYNIKKADVDSFLSESARPLFSYRLLIATTNRIGKKALRTLEDQEKPAGLLLRGDLDRANVVWPETPTDLRAPKPQPKTPRPHNREAIRAVRKGFEDADRGQLVMACGTGKTLIGLWAVEALESRRTLVLLPSLSLLAQTLREWTANAKEPFAFLPVCSDETVRGEDHMVSHTAELGTPVTTDPEVIAAFLRKRGTPRVVFSTYQSSPQVAAAFDEGRVPRFDLVIADEAHRVAGPVSSDFATVLDADLIRARRRLFMTATPRFFSGRVRREASQEEFEIASMDDSAKFGPVFHRLSFGEAIDRDLLTDYQVVIVGVDDPTYRSYVEDGAFVTTDGKEVTHARTLAAHISLAKAMRDFDLRRTISFHSRIAGARTFASEFPDVVAWMPANEQPDGALVCDHVSGRMSSGQRDRRLSRLRDLDDDERGLLSNARCLGEGVDVPTLDGVAFVDPKGSLIDIIQAVGRAIRKADDKTVGTILLPVYVGDTSDPEAALESSAFRPIWSVLKALRAHDEQLAEDLDALRRELGRHSAPSLRLPSRIHVDLPVSVSDAFAQAFTTRLVELSTANWEFWFGLLETYIKRERHAHVHQHHRENEMKLGVWVAVQRRLWVRGNLEPERASRLEALPRWTWDVEADAWENSFKTLRAFVMREGHARVPARHREQDINLGTWVATVRSRYAKGTLDSERSARLEALPGWKWDPMAEDWEEGFSSLTQFIEREGHALVPTHHQEGGFKLGRWVGSQRTARSEGRLDDQRAARLEALPGWVWNTATHAWEEGYNNLVTYVAREGDALVPRDHHEAEHWLGLWVTTQRSNYRKGKLDTQQIARLEDLPGWTWSLKADAWERGYNELKVYVAREGHCRVPMIHREGEYLLGAWVGQQRRQHRLGKLEPDRAARLEAVPGWTWNARAGN